MLACSVFPVTITCIHKIKCNELFVIVLYFVRKVQAISKITESALTFANVPKATRGCLVLLKASYWSFIFFSEKNWWWDPMDLEVWANRDICYDCNSETTVCPNPGISFSNEFEVTGTWTGVSSSKVTL